MADAPVNVSQKHCAKCGAPHHRQGQRYCHVCHAAYMRGWRPSHPLVGAARIKDIARSYANTYQRRGLLTPQPCEQCGSQEPQKHHEDYSKPLDVRWLCRPCHLAIHTVVAADLMEKHSG
jgi:hypothetical protein